MPAFERLDAYLDAQVADHIDHPRDDLTTFLLNATIFDQPLEPRSRPRHRSCCCCSPVSTRRGARSARALLHLASHPDDLARLVADPELMPTAIEEFLRVYAPVTMARLVAKDVELARLPDEGRRLGAAAVPRGQPSTRRRSSAPTRCSSIVPRTATPRSGSASTAASARTWPGSRSASRSRSSSSASRDFELADADAVRGATARSAGRATCRWPSADPPPARRLQVRRNCAGSPIVAVERVDLGDRPRAERVRRAPGTGDERRPRHPLGGVGLVRSLSTTSPSHGGDDHRAQLVLDGAVVHRRAVAEVGQGQREVLTGSVPSSSRRWRRTAWRSVSPGRG